MSTPITTITLYRMPLNPSSNDVMDSGAHAAALGSAEKFVTTPLSFQRHEQKARLEISMDVAGRYNYMSFINNGMTYYAYITSMEYQNDLVTWVSFSIDAWHTYQNYVQYKPTYVLRNTVPSGDDIPGNYIELEPIEPSVYVNTQLSPYFFDRETMRVLVAKVRDAGGTPIAAAYMYNGIYTGARFDNYTPTEAEAYIKSMAEDNTLDAICGIFMMPQELVGTDQHPSEQMSYVIWTPGDVPDSIDGYTPKNKKLLSSVFTTLQITTSDGDSREYAFEFFPGAPQFTIYGSIGAPCSALCRPFMYGQIGGSSLNQYDLSIDFPQGSWSADSFSGWVSTNSAKLMMGGISSAFSLITGIASANPGLILAGANQVAGTVTSTRKAYNNSIVSSGSVRSNALAGQGQLGFHASVKSPRAEEAETIDNFLSMYGYAINKIQPISLNNRPTWDYIQTENAAFSVPNAPVNIENEINNMFNTGIRIWHNANSYGDLSQANG